MSKVGDKALGGEWESISNHKFEVMEEMTLSFQGRSCNILDSEGNIIESLREKDGLAERHVSYGYQCYVMKAKVKFEQRDI